MVIAPPERWRSRTRLVDVWLPCHHGVRMKNELYATLGITRVIHGSLTPWVLRLHDKLAVFALRHARVRRYPRSIDSYDGPTCDALPSVGTSYIGTQGPTARCAAARKPARAVRWRRASRPGELEPLAPCRSSATPLWHCEEPVC